MKLREDVYKSFARTYGGEVGRFLQRDPAFSVLLPDSMDTLSLPSEVLAQSDRYPALSVRWPTPLYSSASSSASRVKHRLTHRAI